MKKMSLVFWTFLMQIATGSKHSTVGSSGHGFKMGPVVGQMAANLVLENRSVEPIFALDRFKKPGESTTQFSTS